MFFMQRYSEVKTCHCFGKNQDVDSTCSEEFFGKLYYTEWFRIVAATATIFVISMISIVSIITIPQTAVNKVVKWRQSYNPPNLTQYEYFDLVTTIHEPTGLCRSSTENYKRQCMSKEPVFLLILVHSTATHFRQRNEIRETWGNLSNLEAYTKGSFRVRVIFLLGVPRVWKDKESTQIKINEESVQYNDILQCSFFDSYYNLTIKHITALKWIKELRPKVSYIFKCDDDVNINVYNLINFITKEKNNRPGDLLVGCQLREITEPSRDPHSKWYCTYKMCPFEVYPRYLYGTGYLMSLKTMLKLYETAQILPLLPFDDVFITGLCAMEAKVEIRDNWQFFPFRKSTKICSYVKGIVTHHNIKLKYVYLSPGKTIQYLALCNTTNKVI